MKLPKRRRLLFAREALLQVRRPIGTLHVNASEGLMNMETCTITINITITITITITIITITNSKVKDGANDASNDPVHVNASEGLMNSFQTTLTPNPEK